MSQQFRDSGQQVPVTKLKIIEAEISQLRKEKKDGYRAIQLKSKQPLNGPCLEFRILTADQKQAYKVGEKFNINRLKGSKKVEAVGFSKGQGFQGPIKRHGFSRGPASHGSHHHRRTGAIGQCVIPSRVFKGKKMPGRMGRKKVTVKNLEIIKREADCLYLKGSLPGANGSYLAVKGM